MHQAPNPTTHDGGASPLVAALERTWQTIRKRHPDVPHAVLVSHRSDPMTRSFND